MGEQRNVMTLHEKNILMKSIKVFPLESLLIKITSIRRAETYLTCQNNKQLKNVFHSSWCFRPHWFFPCMNAFYAHILNKKLNSKKCSDLS